MHYFEPGNPDTDLIFLTLDPDPHKLNTDQQSILQYMIKYAKIGLFYSLQNYYLCRNGTQASKKTVQAAS